MIANSAAGTLAIDVQHIVSDMLGTGIAIDDRTLAADCRQWDSHAMVQIIFAIEDHFGFQMTSAEMETIDGIPSLVAVVVRHAGGAMPAA